MLFSRPKGRKILLGKFADIPGYSQISYVGMLAKLPLTETPEPTPLNTGPLLLSGPHESLGFWASAGSIPASDLAYTFSNPMLFNYGGITETYNSFILVIRRFVGVGTFDTGELLYGTLASGPITLDPAHPVASVQATMYLGTINVINIQN